jgi:hypothetical protein
MSSNSTVENVLTSGAISGTSHTCGDCSHPETSRAKDIVHFTCPVPECNTELAMFASIITRHIKDNHPKISKSMNLGNGRTAIYCQDCDRYATYLHYHCYECESAPDNSGSVKFFRSKEDRDVHLKMEHTKWWLEYYCRHGTECRGYRSGMCGFNHDVGGERFVSDTTTIPSHVCKYDRPWDGVRCKRIRCSYDHFWGRVRALIKKQNTVRVIGSDEKVTNPDRPTGGHSDEEVAVEHA